jgi:hypothetical protein
LQIVPNAVSNDLDWLASEDTSLQNKKEVENTDVNKAFDSIILEVFEEYKKPEEKKTSTLQPKQRHKFLAKKKKK